MDVSVEDAATVLGVSARSVRALLEQVRRDHALRRPGPSDLTNVLLRVPTPHGRSHPGERHAPRLVVATDLMEAGDDRSVRAGRALAG